MRKIVEINEDHPRFLELVNRFKSLNRVHGLNVEAMFKNYKYLTHDGVFINELLTDAQVNSLTTIDKFLDS